MKEAHINQGCLCLQNDLALAAVIELDPEQESIHTSDPGEVPNRTKRGESTIHHGICRCRANLWLHDTEQVGLKLTSPVGIILVGHLYHRQIHPEK